MTITAIKLIVYYGLLYIRLETVSLLVELRGWFGLLVICLC